MGKNYYLLKDTESGTMDAIIVSDKNHEELQEIIRRTKEKEGYQWDDLLDAMPDGTIVVSCMSEDKRIYY